jgi:hypothetical protein
MLKLASVFTLAAHVGYRGPLGINQPTPQPDLARASLSAGEAARMRPKGPFSRTRAAPPREGERQLRRHRTAPFAQTQRCGSAQPRPRRDDRILSRAIVPTDRELAMPMAKPIVREGAVGWTRSP